MKTTKAVRNAVVNAPTDVIEVLDRVLDRGIVIDVWLRVSLAGLQLVDVDARVVVASIKTYVREADAVATRRILAGPEQPEPPAKRPAPRPRPPKARPPRPAVMLRCTNGCTFLRSSRKTQVACPSDRTRTCPVAVVA
jgi:gas vesicle structural protein